MSVAVGGHTTPVAPARANAARPRWRSLLLLSRVSNLPTVWSNVLAGAVAGWAGSASPSLDPGVLLPAVLASSAFYTGGMFLNDAFDAPFDQSARSDRPIPRGEVALGEAFAIGFGLLAVGEALLWPSGEALLLGVILAAAIVFYDRQHKGKAFAPIVMGVCRGLVYLIAAALVTALSNTAAVGGAVMVLYVAGLTVVAKRAGANARWLVPALIAGISLVDAAFILVVRPDALALAVLALLGCPLTLALQRWVPGD